jgi:hypothetical protein
MAGVAGVEGSSVEPSEIEELLCSPVAEAKPAKFGPEDRIPADLVKRLVLSLPIGTSDKCTATPGGIVIEKGVIEGRVELDNAMARDGGPVASMEFRGCTFEGGFSGAHGHFSRLTFDGCTFRDRQPSPEPPEPTIDLSNARIGSWLSMRGIRPASASDHLWIRAIGTRIAGPLDLSCAHLRAPPDNRAARLFSEQPTVALSLKRAEIGGDFYFANGARSEGQIGGRGVHIKGDVWLSGATIETRDPYGLFLPAAVIDGTVTMDRRGDRADESGTVREFICASSVNFRAAEIGDDLHMIDAAVGGSANLLDLTVGNDLILGASVRDSIDLAGCRIGGSLDLTGLAVGVGFSQLKLDDGRIGRSLRRGRRVVDHELVAARHDFLACIPGAQLLETLWVRRYPPDPDEPEPDELVQMGFLVHNGRIFPLDGFATGLDAAVRQCGHAVQGDRSAIEYLRIFGTYAHGEGGFILLTGPEAARRPPFVGPRSRDVEEPPASFFEVNAKLDRGGFSVEACVLQNGRLCRCKFLVTPGDRVVRVAKVRQLGASCDLEGLPRFKGPFACHPEQGDADRKRSIDHRIWVTGLTLGKLVERPAAELGPIRRKLADAVQESLSLRGEVKLDNLACDMLDDQGGQFWGREVRFRMNHFVYRQATWEPDGGEARKPSYRRLRDWLRAAAAERLWPMRLKWFGISRYLRDSTDYWAPWQTRRNWIYQQFDSASRNLCPSRHKIFELEYRPQPFEQAIRVARAEGREDFATRFEMLKHRVEWRLFNRHTRWWLAALAITAASLWLVVHRGSPVVTGAAWLATVLMMVFVSWTLDVIETLFPKWSHTRHVVMLEALFYLPALALLVFAGWWWQPFHFFVALLIYLGIRFVSVIAHAVMRFGFGYLRRPVRAITTLVVAFLVGWWGVVVATANGMLVVDAAPVASLVAPDDFGNVAAPAVEVKLLMASENVAGEKRFARDVSCAPTISAPLYALDVLIPLIDLREESRCEVRDVSEKAKEPPAPESIGDPLQLWENIPEMTLRNNGFWAVMKALYAIAGWFIVSLAILTFAQANRTRGDPV